MDHCSSTAADMHTDPILYNAKQFVVGGRMLQIASKI